MSDEKKEQRSSSVRFIWDKDDNPFKTEADAKAAMIRQGLESNTWSIIGVPNGFALMAKEEEAPPTDFDTKAEAETYMKNRKMDPAIAHVVKDAKTTKWKVVERYFEVIFSAKSNPNDEDDVILAVEGETLIIQRDRKVIIPASFRHAADNATYPKFTQVPGQPRKITGQIKTYPYTMVREATKEEFEVQKNAGTKAVRENVRRYGFNVTPEQVGTNG